jgi:ribosomal protein S18 acetylase RimI-like enzyme
MFRQYASDRGGSREQGNPGPWCPPLTVMEVCIRAAALTESDPVCRLLYLAGPEFWDYFCGGSRASAIDYLRFAFAQGRGLWSPATCTLALLSDRVAGVAAAYTAQQYRRLGLETGRQLVGFYGPRRGVAALDRVRHLGSVLPAPRGNMAYLAQLGVIEELRSQGLGTALIEHVIGRARAGGSRLLALDVAVANSRAQALYERLGFKVTGEHQFPGPPGASPVPDCRRMELVL